MKTNVPKIKYAYSDDLTIAYQVWGTSKDTLVYVPGIVSHLEVTLEFEGYKHWLEKLSKNFKVIIFDKCWPPKMTPKKKIAKVDMRKK